MAARVRDSRRRRCRAGLAGLAIALFLSGCTEPPALTTEAYVWQQATTPAVADAIRRGGPVLDGFLLHAADVSFRGGAPRSIRFDAPWRVVAETGQPGGIVIRIPHADGGLGSVPAHAAMIAELIRSLLDAARAGGVGAPEVQIDYDCPESKLGGYATFLRVLKAQLSDTRLVITALPSWLGSPAFRELARAADGYVLQVHSLTLPAAGDSRAVLCDGRAARAAIRHAEKIGRPFRVALPTYQCVVLVDADGKTVDVISEGAVPSVANGLRAVPGASDPEELANFVAELRANPPRGLTGVIWYRLPVDTDRMNWEWSTFQAVAAGRRPESRLEVALVPDPAGFAALEIRNAGERPEPLPELLRVAWKTGRFESADALNGYEVEPSGTESVCRFRLTQPPLFGLPPGRTVVAGWVRIGGGADPVVSVENR